MKITLRILSNFIAYPFRNSVRWGDRPRRETRPLDDEFNRIKFLLKMKIREGNIQDLQELQKLFVDTVKEICKADYNTEQISVWISSIENKERWQEKLKTQFVLVAEENGKIAGFCSLDKGNYLDLLYVSKDYQRQGVANKLYTEIENEARRLNQPELTSDVSKTARMFFEKMGFIVVKVQTVNIKAVELTNYKMKKSLTK
jgi:putative acetyltransferase